jgi:voltage-gated potassium channel Kch
MMPLELDAPMAHIIRGILMVAATGVVQVLAQLALSRMMDVLPSPPESRYPTFYMLTHSVSAVMILLVGHVLQVNMWAVLYFYDWGAFKNFGTAMYFSLASFTTLGATELSLPPQHRMIGAFESAAGMMMFGWSTALLVAVVVRTDRRARP